MKGPRTHQLNTAINIASLAIASSILLLSGCMVGPKYVQPTVPPPPPTFKETPSNWAQASPQDQLPKGKWWEIYGDPQLNSLEETIAVSNQNLKVAYQQYMSARDLVRQARSQLFPTLAVQPSGSRTQLSQNRPNFAPTTTNQYSDIVLPAEISYEVDLWGQVRRTIESSRENAQASAGDLENVSLSLHSELAFDYFSLRGLDLQKQLLDATVVDFEKALQLTQARYHGGVASDVDVAQAETQLETTRAQDIETGIARAQFEHAIAVLTGQTASTFSLPPAPLTASPPQIPLGLPSELLERRPDIAAAERRVASANAQIGIAIAAYYPQISLSASGGFESTAIETLIQGPSALWSVGGSAFETVLDGGRRRAVTQQARDNHAATVASYRESVLEAFQQVEDNLAALRLLDQELATQQIAVASARRSVDLSTVRYKRGITTYLEVLTAQSIALSDERTAADLMARRMTASVQLIKALGGGWDRTQLPKM
jgi:NodT family efflux transporter outer membrane factor (OMF) lipoprotein